jgi:hypothetical protein
VNVIRTASSVLAKALVLLVVIALAWFLDQAIRPSTSPGTRVGNLITMTGAVIGAVLALGVAMALIVAVLAGSAGYKAHRDELKLLPNETQIAINELKRADKQGWTLDQFAGTAPSLACKLSTDRWILHASYIQFAEIRRNRVVRKASFVGDGLVYIVTFQLPVIRSAVEVWNKIELERLTCPWHDSAPSAVIAIAVRYQLDEAKAILRLEIASDVASRNANLSKPSVAVRGTPPVGTPDRTAGPIEQGATVAAVEGRPFPIATADQTAVVPDGVFAGGDQSAGMMAQYLESLIRGAGDRERDAARKRSREKQAILV